MATAERPPRPAAGARQTLPARAAAGRGRPGHRRQRLRVDLRRRHPRRGRRRPRELLRALRRQEGMPAGRARDPGRRPRRDVAVAYDEPGPGWTGSATPWPRRSTGSPPIRRRRRSCLVELAAVGTDLARALPRGLRALHRAHRRRPRRRRRFPIYRAPPRSPSAPPWPGSTKRWSAIAPRELPRLLPELTYELLVPFVGEEAARTEQRRARSGRRPKCGSSADRFKVRAGRRPRFGDLALRRIGAAISLSLIALNHLTAEPTA